MKSLMGRFFHQINVGAIFIDREYNIIFINHFIEDYTESEETETTGKSLFDIYPELPEEWLKRRIDNTFILKNSSFINWQQRPHLFRFASNRPITGSHENLIQNCTLFPILGDDNITVTHVCISVQDATGVALAQLKVQKTSKRLAKEKASQKALIEQLENTKNQLLQSEKMASIGQLAAGVAHEINNPMAFIKSNFNTLKNYFSDLELTIQEYENFITSNNTNVDILEKTRKKYDLDFLIEDIEELMSDSADGIARVQDIVKSLKEFSRMDENKWEDADINIGIESTLRVVSHELKYVAEVEKDFGDLPQVQCLPMQINQVIMNLLVNAAHSLDKDGKISIRTRKKEDWVIINVQDNGCGIEEEHVLKIFDPFFTTKPVGSGTGLGLSLSYNIITKHSGTITVDSEAGKGTNFEIKLPIKQTGA